MTDSQLCALNGVLDEIEDYLEQREDIRDGSDGQQLPNEEMSLLSDLRWWRTVLPKAADQSHPAAALLPMHKDRYIGFYWPEDIQPHEAEFMAELFALQIPAVRAIAARNVSQSNADDEYLSWGATCTPQP
jgi:hypothetical protein